MTTASTARYHRAGHRTDRHPPLPRRGAAGRPRRPPPAPRRDALAQQGARRRSVAGRAAGDAAGARALLGDEYDWRTAEAKLNALPQFTTEIDGVDIHFLHVKSPHEDALPLIMTHGWPGSVIELLEIVGPLTDPTAHGGSAEDAFHLVLPSLPGYGFSGEPAEVGWDSGRTARAWAELMRRLGYARYVAQGGDRAPASPTRWAARRRRGCSASTSTSSRAALGHRRSRLA